MGVNYLTDEDVRILREMIAKVKRMRERPIDEAEEPLYQAPECLVVLTPPEGIPALNPDLSYGTGTGSGTDFGSEFNTPGEAECDVYKVEKSGSDEVPNLISQEFTVVVYNLMSVDIAGNQWVLVFRDRSGSGWYVPTIGLEFGTC